MKTGTKSLLYGAHQFLLHPIMVAIAWTKLYGFPLDPRIWIAFFIHDIGYWGKPNMDGKEGKTHAELGAKIMHWLFDRYKYKNINYDYHESDNQKQLELMSGWQEVDSLEFIDGSLSVLYRKRNMRWLIFTLYHSRHYAKFIHRSSPSQLCYADKYAFCITPAWLYIPMATATGEIHEYMCITENGKHTYTTDVKEWHTKAVAHHKTFVYTYKDGVINPFPPTTEND